MHDTAILAHIAVTEIVMGVAVHHPHNRRARGRQVVGVHVVGDRRADHFAGLVTQQGLAGIADEGDLVVPVYHEHGVQHQVDQPGVQGLKVYGHGQDVRGKVTDHSAKKCVASIVDLWS
ncbi:hypothetical protein D3C81_1294030 [compost metagenome]